MAVTVRPVGGAANSWTLPSAVRNLDVVALPLLLVVRIRTMAIWLGVW